MELTTEEISRLEQSMKSYPDFPKKGIIFRDIHPLMRDVETRELVLDHLYARYKDKNISAIVGLESRGYYFGIPLAFKMRLPFIALRKAGKLPGDLEGVDYGLEYGKDRLEVQMDSVEKGSRVLIVDDLLATGGTAGAACELLNKLGAEIVECVFLVELVKLQGRNKAPSGVPYYSLLKFSE